MTGMGKLQMSPKRTDTAPTPMSPSQLDFWLSDEEEESNGMSKISNHSTQQGAHRRPKERKEKKRREPGERRSREMDNSNTSISRSRHRDASRNRQHKEKDHTRVRGEDQLHQSWPAMSWEQHNSSSPRSSPRKRSPNKKTLSSRSAHADDKKPPKSKTHSRSPGPGRNGRKVGRKQLADLVTRGLLPPLTEPQHEHHEGGGNLNGPLAAVAAMGMGTPSEAKALAAVSAAASAAAASASQAASLAAALLPKESELKEPQSNSKRFSPYHEDDDEDDLELKKLLAAVASASASAAAAASAAATVAAAISAKQASGKQMEDTTESTATSMEDTSFASRTTL